MSSYKIKRYVGFVSLVIVFVFILSTEAQAALYGFEVIENNSGIGETVAATLSLEVTEPVPGSDEVLFTFINDGPVTSFYAITDIYFEDGTLSGLATIYDKDNNSVLYPGLDFGQPTSPDNMPGWSTLDPKFYATDAFSVDSESPPVANGVGPGESLGLLYTLQSGKTFAHVLTAIELGFADPDEDEPRDSLRIGIHVQGIDGTTDDDSDSFILTPEPGSLLLGSIGIGMVIARCRKRKKLIES